MEEFKLQFSRADATFGEESFWGHFMSLRVAALHFRLLSGATSDVTFRLHIFMNVSRGVVYLELEDFSLLRVVKTIASET